MSVLKSRHMVNPGSLSIIGDPQADIGNMCRSVTAFMVTCYRKSYADCNTMNECRIKMWKRKIGAGTSIKLSSWLPTSEAVTENIKRAHYQVTHWLTLLNGKPPDLNPIDYGWEQDGSMFIPCTVPAGTKESPDGILKMVRCACENSACKGTNFVRSLIGCIVFSACGATSACFNPQTIMMEMLSNRKNKQKLDLNLMTGKQNKKRQYVHIYGSIFNWLYLFQDSHQQQIRKQHVSTCFTLSYRRFMSGTIWPFHTSSIGSLLLGNVYCLCVNYLGPLIDCQ